MSSSAPPAAPARTPHWSVPAYRQHVLLLESGRVWLLLAATVLPVLVLENLRLRGLSLSGDSNLRYSFPVLLDVFQYFAFIAPAWALLVWHGEAWDQRQYHWSLPVPLATHDLWRVAAGAAWLLFASALSCGFGLLLALRAGQSEVLAFGAGFFINYITYPLLYYFAVSALALATRRPLEWTVALVTAAAAILAVAAIFSISVLEDLPDRFTSGRFGLDSAVDGGFLVELIQFPGREPIMVAGHTVRATDRLLASMLWLGIVLAGALIAARRRR